MDKISYKSYLLFFVLFVFLPNKYYCQEENNRALKGWECAKTYKVDLSSFNAGNAEYRNKTIRTIFLSRKRCPTYFKRNLLAIHGYLKKEEKKEIVDSLNYINYNDGLEIKNLNDFKYFSLYGLPFDKYNILKKNDLIKEDLLDELLDANSFDDMYNNFYFRKMGKIEPYIYLASSGDEYYVDKVLEIADKVMKIVSAVDLTDTDKYSAIHLYYGYGLGGYGEFYSKEYTILILDLLDQKIDFNAEWHYDDVIIKTSTGCFVATCIENNFIYPQNFREKWEQKFEPYIYTYKAKDMKKLDELIAQFKKEALAILEANDED